MKIKNILLFLSVLIHPLIGCSKMEIVKDTSESNQEIREAKFSITNSGTADADITLFQAPNQAGLNSFSQLTPTYINSSLVTSFTQYAVFHPINNTLYVSSDFNASIIVVDCVTNTLITTISVASRGYGLAYNSVTNTIYATLYASNQVAVIDADIESLTYNTVLRSITVGSAPFGIAYNPQNNKMYLAQFSSNVSVIDSSDVVTTITVASALRYIAFCPTNNSMYITRASGTGGALYVVNCATDTLSATLLSGQAKHGVIYNATNNTIYVSQDVANTVSVVNCANNTTVAVITGFTNPRGLCWNSVNNLVYVGNATGSNTVRFIDCTTNLLDSTSIATSSFPDEPVYNSVNNTVFVVCTNRVTKLGTPVITPVSSTSISYDDFVAEIIGSPINVLAFNVYSYSGNNNQVTEPITLANVDTFGNTKNNTLAPVINPNQTQSVTKNKVRNFSANGTNYIGYTIIAGETVTIGVPFFQPKKKDITLVIPANKEVERDKDGNEIKKEVSKDDSDDKADISASAGLPPEPAPNYPEEKYEDEGDASEAMVPLTPQKLPEVVNYALVAAVGLFVMYRVSQ